MNVSNTKLTFGPTLNMNAVDMSIRFSECFLDPPRPVSTSYSYRLYVTAPYPAEKLMLAFLSPKVRAAKGSASPKSGAVHEPVPNRAPRPRLVFVDNFMLYLADTMMGQATQVVMTPMPKFFATPN